MRHFRWSLVVLLLPSLLDAQYVKQHETDLGSAAWLLYVVLAAIILIPGFYLLKSRNAATRPSKASRQKKAKVSEDFKQRAAALGFTVGESRTLERIATRLTPKTPHNLLVTGSGQDYLIADLDKRIAQRQREARLLERIKGKIQKMQGRDVHERESIRVEADMPIWVVKKGSQASLEPEALVEDEEAAEEEEDFFSNIESVSGRLVDISEGGAALRVNLGLKKGDRLTFWSADNQIVLAELTGGVITVNTDGGETPMIHVYFIDPDLRELRLALADIRERFPQTSA